jgi:hypothetical protein
VVWDHEAAGSNPVTPSGAISDIRVPHGKRATAEDHARPEMKPRLFALFLSALPVLLAAGLWAQSSPTPGNSPIPAARAELPAALPAASPSPTAPIEPPSLIPPNILPPPGALPKSPIAPELEKLNDLFKQTSLGKIADEQRLHLQMVTLETQIRNDSELHALRTAADAAKTDLERRHRLKTYYEAYYGKLHQLATTPDLQSYLVAQKAAHQLTLLQPHVRHQTDEAAATALFKEGAAAAVVAPVQAPTPVQARATQKLHP